MPKPEKAGAFVAAGMLLRGTGHGPAAAESDMRDQGEL